MASRISTSSCSPSHILRRCCCGVAAPHRSSVASSFPVSNSVDITPARRFSAFLLAASDGGGGGDESPRAVVPVCHYPLTPNSRNSACASFLAANSADTTPALRFSAIFAASDGGDETPRAVVPVRHYAPKPNSVLLSPPPNPSPPQVSVSSIRSSVAGGVSHSSSSSFLASNPKNSTRFSAFSDADGKILPAVRVCHRPRPTPNSVLFSPSPPAHLSLLGNRTPVAVSASFLSSSASQSPRSAPPIPPPHRENPPDAENPDPVTLQEQWRYATRMYSRWYAHAWGTAILAGLSFYGLGWLVKGENPLSMVGAKDKKANEE